MLLVVVYMQLGEFMFCSYDTSSLASLHCLRVTFYNTFLSTMAQLKPKRHNKSYFFLGSDSDLIVLLLSTAPDGLN